VISVSAATGIFLVALGFVLSPGPNMIYLVSRSITQGRRAGLVSLVGVGLGLLVYLCAAAAGLSTLFRAVPWAYVALKLAGAGYLLYLAWQALKPGGRSAFAPQQLKVDPPRRLLLMGLITNLLNPKIAVFYVTLLPQFVDPARGSVAVQSLSLGAIQIAVALAGNALFVVFAGAVSRFLTRRPTWLKIQRYVMGVVLGALAVRIAS